MQGEDENDFPEKLLVYCAKIFSGALGSVKIMPTFSRIK
jgi:hypothetical protein